eukprot:TRINITY_DN55303_c0_g1_i1.p1 TRINITY_DN55303_c0_g1~~TRINITY_DN55303_c0_g1_i1.p1  ORF type:complete len:559 (-),score=60.88 TRINITY_DN55303_c0_g1_i1:82-1758(-)
MDVANAAVRNSTAAIQDVAGEVVKHANSWFGSTEDNVDVRDESGSPPVIIPVPLAALRPWDVGACAGVCSDPMSSSDISSVPSACDGVGDIARGSMDSSPQVAPGQQHRAPPWRANPRLNAKLILWEGDACSLEVDAVVAPTAANFTCGSSSIFTRVLKCGGADLQSDLQHLGACRSGEARITKAYGMACQRLILTLGPKYKEKYHVAAQNTLNSCYRESMQILVEGSFRTVAIPCVWYYQGYPLEEQAHVCLRTIRRCLEKLDHAIDAVVLVARHVREAELYERLLPLYFPRTDEEVVLAAKVLPDCCWNLWGEVTVEERRIRISPLVFASTSDHEDDDGVGDQAEPLFSASDDRAFLDAREDADATAMRRLQATLLEAEDLDAARHAFSRYLRRARELPADPADIRFIFTADEGVTSAPRRVVVLLGARIPDLGVHDERTLPLFVKELDHLQGQRFALLYVNSNVDVLEASKLEVLQEMLAVITARYFGCFDMLLVLHSGLWFRAAFIIGRAVSDIAARVWHESVYVDGLDGLAQYDISIDRLDLPAYILDYELNG